MDIILNTIDTHCHPQLHQYDEDREAVIERALAAGVGMVCVGVDLESSRQAIGLAERYTGLWASVGLHPNDNLDEVYQQEAYAVLAAHPKVVAIGEVGLDYYRTTDAEKKKFQKDRFLRQVQLAHDTSKPLIIHCRDAHADMLQILSSSIFPKGGVIHSFTGTSTQARLYIERGFYIGLNGIVTFSSDYIEMVQSIPIDKLLLETDAPYLAPAPYRGKRNEPVYIRETASFIARIRGLGVDGLIRATTENAKRLLSI
jgi:TatD DNase family protein